MAVARISKQTFRKLLNSKTLPKNSIVVKFYSNHCPYCVRLKDEYHHISDLFEGTHFFVINVDDEGYIDDLVQINGVPTIAVFNVVNSRFEIKILGEPIQPDPASWYHAKQIKQFIEETIND